MGADFITEELIRLVEGQLVRADRGWPGARWQLAGMKRSVCDSNTAKYQGFVSSAKSRGEGMP
jgi:hypothetical protein